MIRLIKYEYLKVIRQPFLIMFFCLLIILNSGLLINEIYADNQEGYSSADVAIVYKQMTKEGAIQPQEMEDWLQQKIIQIEEGSLEESWELYNSILAQIQSINNYQEYWNTLMSGGNSISVLFADEISFSGRNIIKTRQAYQHLQNLSVKAECSEGVLVLTKTNTSDLLILVFTFCILLLLVPREKEEGYSRLTVPMKCGRTRHAVAKYLVLIQTTIMITAICFVINGLILQFTVGLGDLSRSIQSVYGCQTCPYLLCVRDYLIIFLIVKCVGMASAMSIFYLFSVLGNGMLQVTVSAAVYLTLSFVLWSGISPLSWINILHYFNLFHLLDTQAILGDYRNINLFGYPINQILICVIFSGISILGSAVISSRVFGNNRRSLIYKHYRVQILMNKITKPLILPKNLSGFESYKLLVTNGGFALTCLLAVISIAFAYSEPLYMNGQTVAYENYSLKIEGKLSPEKKEYLEQEKIKFEEGILDSQEQQEALNQAYKQYQQLEEREKKGLEVVYFSQTGWERYLGEYGRQKDCQLAGLFMLILLLSSFRYVTMEKDTHMDQIINTVYNGPTLVYHTKFRVMTVYAILLLAVAYIPYTVRLFTYFQMDNWTDRLDSLLLFKGQWGTLRILVFFILYWLCRIVGALTSVAVIYLCQRLTKNRVATLLFSFFILLLPVGTCFLGVTGEWGILPFVTGHSILFFGLI